MREMNYLDKLLDGVAVEWKRLGDVARIKNGKDHKALGDGDFPVYGSGGIMRYADAYAYNKSSVLIPRKGSLGNLFFVDFPFWTVDTIFYTEIDESITHPKYLYYFLTTAGLGEMNQAGGVPSQTQSVLNELKIPIPCPDNPKKSLEIQAEIVRILDAFTSLTAELTTELTNELTARKKQYKHYRDQLLSFENGEVEWKTLREVAEVRSGWGFPNAEQGRDEGLYPFYKVSDMNIAGNETTMITANNYIDSEAAKRLGTKVAPPGTVIFPKIGAAVATNKKRLLSVAAAYDNNVMGLIPGNLMSSRFLFFWMQTVNLSTLANDSGAVPSIRKSEMEEMLVPVPRPEEQARLVAILDKFDALTNSLTEGLPREIELRQKQYAHYRDLLLSFPKPEEVAA